MRYYDDFTHGKIRSYCRIADRRCVHVVSVVAFGHVFAYACEHEAHTDCEVNDHRALFECGGLVGEFAKEQEQKSGTTK